MKIEDGINEIGNLPVIPSWYIPETKEIQAEIDHLKKNHYYASLWLNHLMLNHPKPSVELNAYLPFAREFQVLYDLIVGTKLAIPEWENLDAVKMWVQACKSDANFILEQKGVLSAIENGQSEPNIQSKRSIVAHNANYFKMVDINNAVKADWMPVEYRKVTPEILKDILKTEYRHYIVSQAFGIALKNSKFRSLYWNPYLAVERGVNNTIHSDNRYQYSYLLPDGTRFITGKHRKLPKGFGEATKNQQLHKRRKSEKNITESLQKHEMM